MQQSIKVSKQLLDRLTRLANLRNYSLEELLNHLTTEAEIEQAYQVKHSINSFESPRRLLQD